MTDSTKYLQALEEFIVLGKSAPGAAAVANIQKCISSPNCFVFAELLELPNVQALQNDPDHAKWLEALKLFAYGSYMDYKHQRTTSPNSLPDLSPPQLTKLKQLSLITIASTEPHKLTYPSLQSLLDIPNTRLLEDLIISAIYASLLDAKLDTANQRVEVSSTAGRDVAPGDITNMIAALESWSSSCSSVLTEIEAQIASIQASAVTQRKEQLAYEKAVDDKRKTAEKDGSKGKRVIDHDGLGLGPGEDEMDLDDGPFDDQGGARKTRKGGNRMFSRKR
ncbi:hypothetical protein TWF225_007878 [Orbilia oligospora]|uniref:Uncharacterized protein n=1 Tax=Orbilia oligospora TaxID=2813651 RepID=A0A7C8P699_ORBOL|nr:hypothetical protein TWF751_008037 [Orbilia oligospora]KAF3178574.1 hypothetical protein TWF225_007878 [Orbilia oligospora]KAF3243055.1 hypothetical protein TWF217_011373 [Orbilia oligospora]KAF3260185.1 hypothetical protein TWF128_003652 [Orbilia oligospora]KAF3292081.1 hypothetical protein TWF132_006321 [Orbilia oligospora]